MTYLNGTWLSVKPPPQSGPLCPYSVEKVRSKLTLEGGEEWEEWKERGMHFRWKTQQVRVLEMRTRQICEEAWGSFWLFIRAQG